MTYSWAFFLEKKTLKPKDECTPMFIAALFTGGMPCSIFLIIAKTEKKKKKKKKGGRRTKNHHLMKKSTKPIYLKISMIFFT